MTALPTDPGCGLHQQECLSAYLDGELSLDAQPALFEHLAVCRECRRVMEATLGFRRVVREEYIALPPNADDRFFARLDRVRARQRKVDRAYERSPMWRPHRRVSVGAVVVLTVMVFVIGLVMPRAIPAPSALAEDERVSFERPEGSTVYVIYPGLTVEALRATEIVPLEEW